MGDDAAELHRLLDARNEHPESLAEIDGEIWHRFGRTCAVLVLDMCGFSRLTMRYGITHFLAMIRRLGVIVRPVIAAAGGRVVKTEADNVFAMFDDVPQALAAARTIHDSLATANSFLPEDWDLHAGIGIGYGPLLLIGDARSVRLGDEPRLEAGRGRRGARRDPAVRGGPRPRSGRDRPGRNLRAAVRTCAAGLPLHLSFRLILSLPAESY